MRSPYQRGDSDAYYGRRGRMVPHKWHDALGSQRDENLTPDEVAEYWRGIDENPSGQKDWYAE